MQLRIAVAGRLKPLPVPAFLSSRVRGAACRLEVRADRPSFAMEVSSVAGSRLVEQVLLVEFDHLLLYEFL